MKEKCYSCGKASYSYCFICGEYTCEDHGGYDENYTLENDFFGTQPMWVCDGCSFEQEGTEDG